jgi:hypothetical protein
MPHEYYSRHQIYLAYPPEVLLLLWYATPKNRRVIDMDKLIGTIHLNQSFGLLLLHGRDKVVLAKGASPSSDLCQGVLCCLECTEKPG